VDRSALPVTFGQQLRQWRRQRRFSQLDLALAAEVSQRHLSWLESGKAQPSRAMLLRLADRLDVPLRERNALLLAAGYAPLYVQRGLDDPLLAPALDALQRLLQAHEPFPALAVDRHWNLVAANRMLPLLLRDAAPQLQAPPVNVLRVALHPQGLAPMIHNLPTWRAHLLARLARQQAASGDPVLAALADELRAYPLPPGVADTPDEGEDHGTAPLALPLELRTPTGPLRLISTLAVFGAPHDIVLSELAIESFFPADADSAERLKALAASL
jgi:transcriptional regulator with XRE-family HTH domain